MSEVSPREEIYRRVERSRTLRWTGRIGGPVAALGVYAWLPSGAGALTSEGRATAGVGVLMAVLWMTEAMPLPATSLLPLSLFPLTGILPIDEAAAPFADKVIFLFMGGFMLALAMQRWGLHRRIALMTILLVGTRPASLIGGLMLGSGVLSMWVSNTATTLLMLPIGLSIVDLVETRREDGVDTHGFAVSMLLGIAFASSIGSIGTPIGTSPNLLLKGFVKASYDIDLGFAQWMRFGVPFAAVFGAVAWVVLTRGVRRSGLAEIPGGRALIRRELADLGRVSSGEWTVLAVFSVTALAWVVREPLTNWTWLTDRIPTVAALDDATIAMVATALLFVLPVDVGRGVFVLDWDTARELPWGVLLLFGGGLSLAKAVQTSGLDAWIGGEAEILGGLPERFGTAGLVVLVVAVAVSIGVLTQLTSNTATTATFLPILGGVAIGIGVDPMLLLLPATLTATLAFVLPVATPPNAIVFGSGRVTIGEMVRAGVWLNLIGIVFVIILTFTVAAWVLGIRT